MSMDHVTYHTDVSSGDEYGVCSLCAGIVLDGQTEHECGEPDEDGVLTLLLLDLPVGEFVARAIHPDRGPDAP